jgi:hypothetical protein
MVVNGPISTTVDQYINLTGIEPVSAREYKPLGVDRLVEQAINSNNFIEGISLAEQWLLEVALCFLGLPADAKHDLYTQNLSDLLVALNVLSPKERKKLVGIGHFRNQLAHRVFRQGPIERSSVTEHANKLISMADMVIKRGFVYLTTRHLLDERDDFKRLFRQKVMWRMTISVVMGNDDDLFDKEFRAKARELISQLRIDEPILWQKYYKTG